MIFVIKNTFLKNNISLETLLNNLKINDTEKFQCVFAYFSKMHTICILLHTISNQNYFHTQWNLAQQHTISTTLIDFHIRRNYALRFQIGSYWSINHFLKLPSAWQSILTPGHSLLQKQPDQRSIKAKSFTSNFRMTGLPNLVFVFYLSDVTTVDSQFLICLRVYFLGNLAIVM